MKGGSKKNDMEVVFDRLITLEKRSNEQFSQLEVLE